MSFSLQDCRIDRLYPFYGVDIDVLRLDLIHPLVSGNKWFKLKEYLALAKEGNKNTILTFGGAYSNHIVATAAAAKADGLKSIGIIRGEEPKEWSHTLSTANQLDMQLFFIQRSAYKEKTIPAEVYDLADSASLLEIPEGGYGTLGKQGAEAILRGFDTSPYSFIITAVGTGTTLAGLTEIVGVGQKVIGIPVLKNARSLQQEVEYLLSPSKLQAFELIWDYHFGGYAKLSKEVIYFMNQFFIKTGIPTDFVYTGKAFLAVFDLFQKGYFMPADKILLIHTGGLQGNHSLPKGTLIFS